MTRCTSPDDSYALELPLTAPVGKDNALHEGPEYLDWAANREIIMQVRIS